jgi:protein O-GlcNAc transferase
VTHNYKTHISKLISDEQFDAALTAFEKIIDSEKKNNPITLNDRGVLLLRLRRYKEAIIDFENAILINGTIHLVYYNLAKAYFKDEQYDNSLKNIFKALELNSNFEHSRLLLAEIYIIKKMPSLAIEELSKIKDNLFEAFMMSSDLELQLCNWDRYERDKLQFKKKLTENKNYQLLSNCFHSIILEDDPELHLKIATKVSIFLKEESNKIKLEKFLKNKLNKKIKIAYISADFWNHPMGHLLKTFFENHDRTLFEIYGFNIGKIRNTDQYYLKIKNSFDFFFDIDQNLFDQDLIIKIRNLNIDIAVDLMGYTKNCRPFIFVKRIAPIQINYLGYPGTLGADYIDYIMADSFIIPNHMKKYYAEKVLYLPHCYQVNDDTKLISSRFKKKADVGLNENDFIFCSFNKSTKINPTIFKIWMNILIKTTNSVLWLWVENEESKQNLYNEAEKCNVNRQRIIFAPRVSLEDHLCRYQFADLFLDTYPYTSHVTASDCLWSGTPLLSICGNSFASRVSSSLLHTLHLDELITYNLEEYEKKAIDLFFNKNKLKEIKDKLSINRKKSSLFNTKLVTKQIEDIYLNLTNSKI